MNSQLKKKKVLHIITRLDRGGSAENVILTCQYLGQEKYEPILICGPGETRDDVDKYFYVRIIPELVRKISILNDLIAYFKIYKIIKQEEPDIVHTHSSKAGVLGRWAAWLYNSTRNLGLKSRNYEIRHTKTIHTPHGHVFYGYFGKFKSFIYVLLERLTAKITDKLIALTEGEKKESLDYGIGKSHQWAIVHSGVKGIQERISNLRDALNISKDDMVIGTVARLVPVKGVKYFVEAMKVINKKYPALTNYKFLIVGGGHQRKDIEFNINKSGINDKVILTGMRDDIPDLISIMDIYVQPSLNEGMGKTIVLAQLLGKPIIATNVQGIPSLIKDHDTGILVPSRNPEKLAEAIVELIKNKELRVKLASQSKRWATEIVDGFQRFSIVRMIHLLTILYDNLFKQA